MVDIMKTLTLRYLLTITVFCVFGVTSVNGFADDVDPVGTVLFVHGEVSIFSPTGEKRNANRGDAVFEGDRIVSSAASSMQIKMVDSGYLAIRPSTEIRIDKYRFEQTQDDRAETSLLKGGLRSITGTIGKTRKESFKLRTPVATIGIRGTDLEVFYVPSGRDKLLAQGAYLRINSGKGYLQTFEGVQFVNPNQTGYVRDKRELPKLIQLPADFFNQPDAQFWPENDSDSTESDENGELSQEGSDENDLDNLKEGTAEFDSVSSEESEPEYVDLDLPPDLMESWNSEAEFEDQPDFVLQETDLGVFEQFTSPDAISNQTGTFNYKATSLDIAGATPTGSNVELNVDFSAGTLDYNLYLDFSSGTVGPVPSALAGSSGGAWLFSGSGQLSDFLSAQGMGISGFYYDTSGGENVANGIWYGAFIGTGAEELISGFTLCQGSYNADGSCSGVGLEGGTYSDSRTEATETFSPLTGDYVLAAFPRDSAFMNNGYSRLAESSDGYSTVTVSSLDGRVVAFEQAAFDDTGIGGSERFEALSDETVFGYSKNDGVDTAYWGYWDGYAYTGEDGVTSSTDQNFYYTYLDSSALHEWGDAGRPNMQAKFNLTGGVAHDGNGRELFFNSANSYMFMDFNSGIMQGQFEMATNDEQETQDTWYLQSNNISLDSIYNGMGSTNLQGSVETADSNGSVLNSAGVVGSWDFLWGGSESNYLLGSFGASGFYVDQSGTIYYSSAGVLVFNESDNALNDATLGSGLSGIATGYGDGFFMGLGFNLGDQSDASGYYESSDALIGFYENHLGLTVNDGSAVLFRDQSTYNVSLDEYSLQAEGNYTVVGGNGIRNADGAVVSEVNWGRWMSDSAGDILSSNGGSVEEMKALHYIAATNLTPQSTLDNLMYAQTIATFSFAGGTSPTLISGDNVSTGTVNKLNLAVDFMQNQIDSDMALDFNGDSITALGSSSIDAFRGAGFALEAFRSGSKIGNGFIRGDFVGPNADGAIVGYDLTIDKGQINGAAALQRTQ